MFNTIELQVKANGGLEVGRGVGVPINGWILEIFRRQN